MVTRFSSSINRLENLSSSFFRKLKPLCKAQRAVSNESWSLYWSIYIFIIRQAILQSISSVLIGYFSVGILQYGPLPWKRSFLGIFFSLLGSRKIQTAKTQEDLKKGKVWSW